MEINKEKGSLSLKYETLVGDVEKQISDLEELGFSMKGYRDKINDIKKNMVDKIQRNRGNDKNIAVNEGQLNTSDLSSLYIDSISTLEKMNKEIFDEYNPFFILFKNSSYLDECLSRIKVSDNPVSLLDETIDLLDKIEASPTSDYSQVKKIIEDSYRTIYNVMKLETLTGSSSFSESVFSAVQKSRIHSSFITRLVQEECEKSQDPKVLSKFHQLETMGMGSNILIDTSLFRLLALSTESSYVKSLQESTQASTEEYKKIIESIKDQATTLQYSKNRYEANLKSQRNDLFKALRRAAFILASLGVAGAISVSTFKAVEKNDIKYRITSTEYDLQTGESYEGKDNGEYSFAGLSSVSVEKETPWEFRENKNDYVKYITRYDLETSPLAKEPSDYLKLIKGLNYSHVETKFMTEKPCEFDEQITKYFVTIREFDYDDIRKGDMAFLSLLLSACIFLLIELIGFHLY